MVKVKSTKTKTKSSSKSKGTSNKEQFKVASHEILKKVKELIKEGNVRRIIIKNEKGKTLMEIPVTVAVIGVVVAPYFSRCWRLSRFSQSGND